MNRNMEVCMSSQVNSTMSDEVKGMMNNEVNNTINNETQDSGTGRNKKGKNKEYKPLGKALSVVFTFIPMLGGFLIQLGVMFVAMIGYTVYYMSTNSGAAIDAMELQNRMTSIDVLWPISVASILVTAIVFPIWYYLMFKRAPKTKVKTYATPKNIILMVVLGISVQICITIALTTILSLMPKVSESYSEHMNTITGGTLLGNLFLTVVLAPLAEECIFRGLTLRFARNYMPLILANVVQAVLFGVYHMQLVQGIYAFVLGIILGYVAIKFKSVIPTIILHMIINASAFFVGYILPEKLLDSTPLCIALIVVSAVVIVLAMKFLSPKQIVSDKN